MSGMFQSSFWEIYSLLQVCVYSIKSLWIVHKHSLDLVLLSTVICASEWFQWVHALLSSSLLNQIAMGPSYPSQVPISTWSNNKGTVKNIIDRTARYDTFVDSMGIIDGPGCENVLCHSFEMCAIGSVNKTCLHASKQLLHNMLQSHCHRNINVWPARQSTTI